MDKIAEAGQLAQNSWDRTAGDKIARTGQPRKTLGITENFLTV
jgi:hypothetical protein